MVMYTNPIVIVMYTLHALLIVMNTDLHLINVQPSMLIAQWVKYGDVLKISLDVTFDAN